MLEHVVVFGQDRQPGPAADLHLPHLFQRQKTSFGILFVLERCEDQGRAR